MESRQERRTAIREAALVGGWDMVKFLLEPTTTPSPATPSTQSTTPYSTQVWRRVMGPVFTSLSHPASNVPTSSNTQGSGKSLSYVQRAIEELAETLQSKNEDYRIGGEFSNFEYAAEVSSTTTAEVMLTQIGIKVGRLIGLKENPNNESFKDSVKDLAGYAVILYAYLMSEDEVWVPGPNSEGEF